MLGAAYGHIRETVIKGDYAPYNFFTSEVRVLGTYRASPFRAELKAG